MKRRDRNIITWLVIAAVIILIISIGIAEYSRRTMKKEIIHAAFFPDEKTGNNIEIYFCLKDNCTEILKNSINAADKAHCALFDVSLKDVIEAFNASYKNGKDVKLIVDNNNFRKVSNLAFARHDTSSQLSHNKFCIFDDKKILTGSFNPTTWADKNDNNIIIIDSEYLATNYEDEFSELWHGTFGTGNKVKHQKIRYNNITIENYFCPEDDCETRILENLRAGNKSIYFMAFSFTSKAISDIIVSKHAKGVEIIGIYEKSQANIWKEYSFISAKPLKILPDSNKYNMHHKVFIIDNNTVITGSMNPTVSGNTRNDENIIIMHDESIAVKFSEEFFSILPNENI